MLKVIIYNLIMRLRFVKGSWNIYNKRPVEIQQAFKKNYFININKQCSEHSS